MEAEFSSREVACKVARLQAVVFLRQIEISGDLIGVHFEESPRDLDINVSRGGYLIRAISPQEYTSVNAQHPDLNRFEVNHSNLLQVITWLKKRDNLL